MRFFRGLWQCQHMERIPAPSHLVYTPVELMRVNDCSSNLREEKIKWTNTGDEINNFVLAVFFFF